MPNSLNLIDIDFRGKKGGEFLILLQKSLSEFDLEYLLPAQSLKKF